VRGWGKALLAVAVVLAGVAWLYGYRLAPAHFAGVREAVLRVVHFSEGAALLVRTADGNCAVVVARRLGPVWRRDGRAECGREDAAHPFRYTGLGRSEQSQEGRWAYLAVGGIFSDGRVAAVRMAGQAEQAVSPDSGYLFVYEAEDLIGAFPPAQALAADGSVLYTLHAEYDWDWRPFPSPLPQPGRVARQGKVDRDALAAGPWDGRPRSVWLNGEVDADDEWKPFFV